jgi:hypothetical protein
MAISTLGQRVIETSEKGQADLTKAAGINALPTTPLNAQVIGANADSAKMTGTPAQQKNAIKFSMEDQQELSDIQRTDRVGVVKDDRTTNKGLAGLGSLRNRVVELTVDKIKQQQLKQLVPPNISLDAAKTMSNDEPTQQKIVSLATTVQTETDPTKKLTAYSELKGLVSAAQLTQLVGADASNFAQSVASQIDDKFMFKDIPISLIQDAGIDMNDIATAAGIPSEDLGKMSWGEVKQKVSEEQTKRFADIPQLESIAFDATQPMQAQIEARKRLRELGVAGSRAAEKQTKTLVDRIEQDEVLTIDGKNYTIDSILNNATIQDSLIQAVDNPDSLKGGPYESLIPFVQQHKDEIKQWQNKFVTAGKEIETNLVDFTNVTKSSADLPIPDTLLNSFYTKEEIDAAKKGIAKLDPTKIPAIWKIDTRALATKLGMDEAGAKGRLAAVMNAIAQNITDPELGPILKGLDETKLMDYGFFTNPGEAVARMKETSRFIKMLEDSDPSNDQAAMDGIDASTPLARMGNLIDEAKPQLDLPTIRDRLRKERQAGYDAANLAASVAAQAEAAKVEAARLEAIRKEEENKKAEADAAGKLYVPTYKSPNGIPMGPAQLKAAVKAAEDAKKAADKAKKDAAKAKKPPPAPKVVKAPVERDKGRGK